MLGTENCLQRELSSKKDALLDQMIACGGEYHQSTLYGMQLLWGLLDLRDVKFSQFIALPFNFDVLISSQ